VGWGLIWRNSEKGIESRGLGWKKEKARGLSAKQPSSSSPSIQNKEREGGGSGAAGRRRLPASRASAAVEQ
jgi:hypothetical protein